MITKLPKPQSFLASLGQGSPRDADMEDIAVNLDQIHRAAHEPVIQAMAMCDLVRKSNVIWKKIKATQSPVDAPSVPVPLQHQVPGRNRSGVVHSAFFTRKRVIEAMRLQLFNELAMLLNCPVHLLPNHIEERYEIQVKADKKQEDEDKGNRLVRLGKAERAKRKITFYRGLAWMMEQDSGGFLPADTSSNFRTNNAKHRRWCFGYVFAGNALYMEDHNSVGTTLAFFHSSYLKGREVECAGDISFRKGKLTSISNLSGHYAPPASHLVPVLRFLRLNGLDIDDAQVTLSSGNDNLMNLSADSADDMTVPYEDADIDERTVAQFLTSATATRADAPRAQVVTRRRR